MTQDSMADTCDCVTVQGSPEIEKSALLAKALRSAATRQVVTRNSPVGKQFR
jgi:hypothetical protein